MKYGISFFALVLIISIAFSCQNSEKNIRDQAKNSADSLVTLDSLKKNLIGVWKTVSFTVNVNTFNNSDSSYSMVVGHGDWEAKLNLKPFLTHFRPNNTYEMAVVNLNDSIVEANRGIWSVFGDTLMLVEPDATYQYKVKAKNQHLQFEALLDWDGDGQEDDEYRRIEQRAKLEDLPK